MVVLIAQQKAISPKRYGLSTGTADRNHLAPIYAIIHYAFESR